MRCFELKTNWRSSWMTELKKANSDSRKSPFLYSRGLRVVSAASSSENRAMSTWLDGSSSLVIILSYWLTRGNWLMNSFLQERCISWADFLIWRRLWQRKGRICINSEMLLKYNTNWSYPRSWRERESLDEFNTLLQESADTAIIMEMHFGHSTLRMIYTLIDESYNKIIGDIPLNELDKLKCVPSFFVKIVAQ